MPRRHVPYTFHKKKYIPPDDAYAYHSYVMNEVDRAFLSLMFEHGVAVHICETEMKAKYFAMRIRCIIYKKDKGLVKLCKFAVRNNEVIGWTMDIYPQKSMSPQLHERAKDMGWVTFYSQLKEPPVVLDSRKQKVLKEDEEEQMSMESEEAIRKYIKSREGEEE